MARPSIFISSTYYDLKHIRSSLEQFINTLGYDSVLSEKGNIAYSSSLALDESCYRDAQNCDIFVLIIGGRYGSEISKTRENGDDKKFYDRYESVTKREFDHAYDSDIPVYILIEKAVFSEFETYQRNRNNESISYAHVDSVNIFRFIETIVSKPRNNPIFQFEKESEIEEWMREQWAGLFKDMLSERLESKRLASLSEKVNELGDINTTLKHYLEAIINKMSTNGDPVSNVIHDEEKRLEEKRVFDKLMAISVFKELTEYDVSFEEAKLVFSQATTIDDLTVKVEKITDDQLDSRQVLAHWKGNPEIIEKIQKVREILGKEHLSFEE